MYHGNLSHLFGLHGKDSRVTKKTMKNIITTALMLTLGMSAMAQKSISQNIDEKNGKMTIHIESSDNGKKEVFDKSYNVEGMSES